MNHDADQVPDAVVAGLLQALRAAQPQCLIAHDPAQDRITISEAEGTLSRVLVLDDARRAVEDMSASDQQAFFARVAASTLREPAGPEHIPSLRLRVATAAQVQLRGLHIRGTRLPDLRDVPVPDNPLDAIHVLDFAITAGELVTGGSGDILLHPVIDHGSTVQYVHADAAAAMGLDARGVQEAAIENMSHELLPPEEMWVRLSDTVYGMETTGRFRVAAMVALLPVIATPDAPARELLFCFPTQIDCLLSVDRSDASIAEMLRLADEIAEDRERFSDAVWEYSEAGWAVYDPGPNGSLAAHRAAGRERHLASKRHYEALKPWLDAVGFPIILQHRDVYLHPSDQSYRSSTVFAGAGTLMPHADEVALPVGGQFKPGATNQTVDWHDFVAIMDFDPDQSFQGTVPPLYWFDKDPDAAQIKALDAVAQKRFEP